MKSITVLKLKIGEESWPALVQIGQACRKARNVALEDWLLRQRGKPESERQSKRLVVRKDKTSDQPKSESTKLYHAIREGVPELGTTQASMVSAAVWSSLSAKVDWRRGSGDNGKRMRRRDAILSYEDRPPFFTALEIPLHNAHTVVKFTDRLTLTIGRPLDSVPVLVVDVSLRDLPPGKQLLLRELASKKRKLADSKLVERDGQWYWHVPLTFETEVLSDRTAELWPVLGTTRDGKQQDRPFRLDLPGRRPWYVGDGRYLLSQTARLIGLRKQIGWRYQQRMGAGHGRQKIDEAVRRRRQQEKNMRTEVLRRAIADVVRQCVREKCGCLVYHEPSLPLRKRCWFQAAGLDWDWTKFEADLRNAAARQGVAVETKAWKWKEAFPDEVEQEAAAV